MAGNEQGFGATLTFSSGFAANITSMSPSGWAREAFETSYLGMSESGFTYVPSAKYEPGELTVEINWNSTKNPGTPMAAAAETVTITYPLPSGLSTAATHVCSGFAIGFDSAIPLKGLMTCTIKIKLSGTVTWTPAA